MAVEEAGSGSDSQQRHRTTRRRRVLVAVVCAVAVVAVVAGVLLTRGGPAARDACGPRPTKADGSLWRCTFDDEFDGSALNRSKWVPQTVFVSGSRTGAHACYGGGPQNVAVSGGALHLTLRWLPTVIGCPAGFPPTHYSAGMVSTFHRFSQRYGRFEARVRAPLTFQPGLNEVLWLWPDKRYTKVHWPASGEIDVSQQFSNAPWITIPFLHYTANDNGGPHLGLNTARCPAPRGVWNTYDLVWTPRSITISVNGKHCLTNTSADPAFHKRYIVDLTEALGTGADAPSRWLRLPATMDVDYVRVWR